MEHQPVPFRVLLAKIRWGQAVAWSIKLSIATGMLILAAGVIAMRGKAAEIDTPSNYARIQAQNDALVIELSGLNRNLAMLMDGFAASRAMATETRGLVGLEASVSKIPIPEDPADILPPSPESAYSAALTQAAHTLDESLEHARALRVSFEEIVAHMEHDAETWACIPSTRPVERARLTSSFGRRRDPFTGRLAWHRGLDLSAPRGTPVVASAEGRVLRAGYYGGYGRLVEMDHGNGLHTRYAHNSRLAVKVGQWVSRGEILAYVGSSGRANAPHLHYEVHLDGEAVNPEHYILPEVLVAD